MATGHLIERASAAFSGDWVVSCQWVAIVQDAIRRVAVVMGKRTSSAGVPVPNIGLHSVGATGGIAMLINHVVLGYAELGPDELCTGAA